MTAPSHAGVSTRPEVTTGAIFALAFVALFAYLDWITHRDVATTVVLAAAAAGSILYRRAIVDWLNLRPQLDRLSPRVRPLLAAIPGLAYFLFRGQGTSGAGGIVLVSMLGVVGANMVIGPQLDEKLAAFYVTRNKVLPRPVRMALALVVPVLIAFLVVHGSLGDLPAMFGGTTKHPATPDGLEGRFLLATLLSAAVSWLLLREAPRGAAGGAQARTTSSYVAPPAGLDVYAAPGDATPVTRLEPGHALRLLRRTGDWAEVERADGTTGWVDGRLLEERR